MSTHVSVHLYLCSLNLHMFVHAVVYMCQCICKYFVHPNINPFALTRSPGLKDDPARLVSGLAFCPRRLCAKKDRKMDVDAIHTRDFAFALAGMFPGLCCCQIPG